MIQCEAYGASVGPLVCASRHRKALKDPDSYRHCRECRHGIEAASKEPEKKKPRKRRIKKPMSYDTQTHPCPECGEPTRGRVCVKCKIKTEAKTMEEKKRKKPPCEEEGCNTPRWSRGLCYKHYARRFGNPKKSNGKKSVAATETGQPSQGSALIPDRKAMLAQLMLCSEQLDGIIQDLLAGKPDIPVSGIFDVRARLGELGKSMIS